MAAIAYRTADVDGFKVFYREAGNAGRADAAAAARLPELQPHVPRSDPAARRPFPRRRARSAGLRPVRHAGARDVRLHLRPYRRRHRPLHRGRSASTALRSTSSTTARRPASGIAPQHPERITAIISQNGNAYEEGLSDGWNPIRAYWKDPSQANREALARLPRRRRRRSGNTRTASPMRRAVSPDGYTLDNFYLARPGADEVQLDLFRDYESNVALYPGFQNYFRTHQPPLLAVWGKNDPFFLPPGAEAFKRDIPDADVRFFDTGHFALETHAGRDRARRSATSLPR